MQIVAILDNFQKMSSPDFCGDKKSISKCHLLKILSSMQSFKTPQTEPYSFFMKH